MIMITGVSGGGSDLACQYIGKLTPLNPVLFVVGVYFLREQDLFGENIGVIVRHSNLEFYEFAVGALEIG